MPWWCLVSDNASYFADKHKPLVRDWPLQHQSFICPSCDVEGTRHAIYWNTLKSFMQ